jgi:hypothetical protein
VQQNWRSSNIGVLTSANLCTHGVRSLVVLHVIYSPATTRQSYDRRAPRVRFGSGGKQAVKLLYWLRKLRCGPPGLTPLVSRDSRGAHLSHGR